MKFEQPSYNNNIFKFSNILKYITFKVIAKNNLYV